jgi:hypothetical protein
MLHRIASFSAAFLALPLVAWIAAEEQITLAVPNLQ